MHTTRTLLGCAAAIALAASSWALAADPLSEVCSYQGYLTESSGPAMGEYDFRFTLYDAETGGFIVGTTVDKPSIYVSRGLFTTELEFGRDPFNGEERWLEIQVRSSTGGGMYTTLSPRQKITPSAYALAAVQLNLPYEATMDTDTTMFSMTQTGMQRSGLFMINNPANAMNALTAQTNGEGKGLLVGNTGLGGAALFDIPITTNDQHVLHCVHAGVGRVGLFEATSIDNPMPALEVRQSGLGPAIRTQGDIEVDGDVLADQFVSTAPDGTAPLEVDSTTLVPNLNAQFLGGFRSTELGRRTHFWLPGAGGSVAFDIPHYNACQITVAEAFASPQYIGFLHVIENDRQIAYIGFDGDGTLVRGTASLWSSTPIMTVGPNITVSTPGDGSYMLVVDSVGQDVRGVAIW